MPRKTLPSLVGFFAVVLSMVAIGLLTSCGAGGLPHDVAIVRAYTDASGAPTPHADSLGFTYGPADGGGAKYEVAGYNCLVNETMLGDPDEDRIVRVVIHELENAQVLRAGEFPRDLDGGWYLWSSENRAPYEWIGPDEAAWVASLPRLIVRVHPRDPWAVEPTRAAVERLNEAAGAEVFTMQAAAGP